MKVTICSLTTASTACRLAKNSHNLSKQSANELFEGAASVFVNIYHHGGMFLLRESSVFLPIHTPDILHDSLITTKAQGVHEATIPWTTKSIHHIRSVYRACGMESFISMSIKYYTIQKPKITFFVVICKVRISLEKNAAKTSKIIFEKPDWKTDKKYPPIYLMSRTKKMTERMKGGLERIFLPSTALSFLLWTTVPSKNSTSKSCSQHERANGLLKASSTWLKHRTAGNHRIPARFKLEIRRSRQVFTPVLSVGHCRFLNSMQNIQYFWICHVVLKSFAFKLHQNPIYPRTVNYFSSQ